MDFFLLQLSRQFTQTVPLCCDRRNCQSCSHKMIAVIRVISILLSCDAYYFEDSSSANLNQLNRGIDYSSERDGAAFLQMYNVQIRRLASESSKADFAYQCAMIPKNSKQSNRAADRLSEFTEKMYATAEKFAWRNFSDYQRRQFKQIVKLGRNPLSVQDSSRLNSVIGEMQDIYSKTTTCVSGQCDQALEPELTRLLEEEKDYHLQAEAWNAWREACGVQIRPLFAEYVKLSNKAAQGNGFADHGKVWLDEWEYDNFSGLMENLWAEVEPMYKKLHAYVRWRLRKFYGNLMPADGTIPCHLLGDMWSQRWLQTKFEMVEPFPGKVLVDGAKIKAAMLSKGYTQRTMFEKADDFFTSLGLDPMTEVFWQRSMFTKPKNVPAVCHASAWDLYDCQSFSVKMCTEVEMSDLITVHHEMGHVAYFMLYSRQPYLYRDGSNSATHEAVGDFIALSAASPCHFQKLGLIKSCDGDYEHQINYLMFMALQKLAFLPSAYLMDLYRWKVFSGEIPLDEMERGWWDLRLKIQGVSPPFPRSERHFDAGTKYHTNVDSSYDRYFIACFFQFMFHETACKIAQPDVPLWKCDTYSNKEVGDLLRKVLSQGSSVPWPIQLEQLCGTSEISAKPFLNYLKPLEGFLDRALAESGETPGWTSNVDAYMTQN